MASEHHRKVGASHPWDKGRLNIPVEPPIGGFPPHYLEKVALRIELGAELFPKNKLPWE